MKFCDVSAHFDLGVNSSRPYILKGIGVLCILFQLTMPSLA